MKNLIFFIFSLFMFSCETDEGLSPLSVKENGNFVKIEISRKCLSIENPAITFDGLLTNPGGKSVKFNLYVRLTEESSQASLGDFKLIKTVTSFPFNLSLSIADIANALQVPIGDLKENDQFRFYGESFDAQGVRSDYSSLSGQIRSNLDGYKAAYRFRTQILNNIFFLPVNSNNYDAFDNFTPQ